MDQKFLNGGGRGQAKKWLTNQLFLIKGWSTTTVLAVAAGVVKGA